MMPVALLFLISNILSSGVTRLMFGYQPNMEKPLLSLFGFPVYPIPFFNGIFHWYILYNNIPWARIIIFKGFIVLSLSMIFFLLPLRLRKNAFRIPIRKGITIRPNDRRNKGTVIDFNKEKDKVYVYFLNKKNRKEATKPFSIRELRSYFGGRSLTYCNEPKYLDKTLIYIVFILLALTSFIKVWTGT